MESKSHEMEMFIFYFSFFFHNVLHYRGLQLNQNMDVKYCVIS